MKWTLKCPLIQRTVEVSVEWLNSFADPLPPNLCDISNEGLHKLFNFYFLFTPIHYKTVTGQTSVLPLSWKIISWPFTYTASASVNRKQTVYSTVCCLIAENTANQESNGKKNYQAFLCLDRQWGERVVSQTSLPPLVVDSWLDVSNCRCLYHCFPNDPL